MAPLRRRLPGRSGVPAAGSAVRPPDAVIVGAQKAATTSLLRTLAQHPDVVTPRVQEAVNLHAGTDEWAPWVREYEPQLVGVHCGVLVVKLATAMHFADTLETIKGLNPSAVVIAVLRHPVERMLSLHRYAVQHGMESRPVDEALLDDTVQRAERWRLTSYSGGSRYADAIAAMERVFERDRTVYVDYAEVSSGAWLPRVFEALRLEGPAPGAITANESRPPRSAALARLMNRRATRSLGRAVVPAPWRESLRSVVQMWNAKAADPAAADGISPELRASLVDRHLPDVEAAERVLGAELPGWRT